MRRRCIGCNSVLSDNPEESCCSVCKGCLHPERLEARLAAGNSPLSDTLLRVGRSMGVVAGGEK